MFSIVHTDGSGEDDVPIDKLSGLFDELIESTSEHGDVSVVSQDSGWCLSAHRDGRVVFEHLSDGGQRHMMPVSKPAVLALWRQLINGDIEGLQRQPWTMGYV